MTMLQEYSVEFSCYFNVMWTEPRLVLPPKFLEVLHSTSPGFLFSQTYISYIPEYMFYYSRK